MDKLRSASQDVRRQITPAKRLEILDEIYFVRQVEEQFLDGEIGSSVCAIGGVYDTDWK